MTRLGPRLRASCLGLGCVLLVLAGLAVEPHAWDRGGHLHHEAREALDGHLHVVESHPEQPLHIEGSATHDEPHCRLCLLRGPTVDGGPRPVAAAVLAAAGGRWRRAHRIPPAVGAVALLPARAPPTSS